MFIVLEGLDGAGKTTLMNELARRLTAAGVPHIVTREPGGTPFGDAMRAVLLSKDYGDVDPLAELLAFQAIRAQHVAKVIKPALAEGKVVLCDRFTASTIAYQGYGRGMSTTMIEHLNQLASAGVLPSLCVLLDVPATLAAERRSKREEDRIELERSGFHERVRTGFLEQAAEARMSAVTSTVWIVSEPGAETMATADRVWPWMARR